MTQNPLSRRGLFGVLAAFLSQAAAAAVRKKSKADAGYQSKAKSIYGCSTCSSFRSPVSCVMVEGAVNRGGWCRLYSYPD